jgi:hypothetical protein
MQYGVCTLSIIPMRGEPSDASEMVNQVLFGEAFKILESNAKWNLVRLAHDKYEGWIDVKQTQLVSEEEYLKWVNAGHPLANDAIGLARSDNEAHNVVMGSPLPYYKDQKVLFPQSQFPLHGDITNQKREKSELIDIAYSYLDAPYLWGGRTPFGIDCSGFTQMVYRLGGYSLNRDASQQAKQGEVLSFIEEAEPGDLAFFDNAEGKIIHVGIILENHYIIHASGKVRLDRLDQSGIYNAELDQHTHKLRVMKRMF